MMFAPFCTSVSSLVLICHRFHISFALVPNSSLSPRDDHAR